MSEFKKIIIRITLSISVIAIIATILDNKKLIVKKIPKIAIIYPLSYKCIDDIKDGFLNEITKHMDIEYDLYDGNSDKMLLNSQVQQIINGDYDLTFAITTSPFVLLVEQANQKHKNVPIVASAADIRQLVNKNHTRNYVAISNEDDSKDKIQMLIDLYNPEKIIVPHTSSPMIESQVKDIALICNEKGIKFAPIVIYNSQEIQMKMEHEFSNKRELILTLGDNFIIANMEVLVSLCKKSNKIICSSDLESIENGVCFAYGIQYYDEGVLGAKQAVEILIHKKKVNELENINLEENKIRINLDNPMHKELNLDLLKTTYKDQVIWYSKDEKVKDN
jgi:putative ABC transport system substrate-binding protein